MLTAAALLGPATFEARAVQIQDVVRLKGSETSKLVGMGLVVGLTGTGDGEKYLPAIRMLTETTRAFVDDSTVPADVRDSKNVAVVYLEATVPATGVREGDRVDVHVSAVGRSKTLKGGRLMIMPMTGPLPGSPIYAWASGALTIQDPQTPTVAVIKHGAQLVEDISTKLLDSQGRITLVLNDEIASWPVAHNVASVINQTLAPDGPDLAMAVDQKNVIVQVPQSLLSNPGLMATQVMRSYIDQDQIRAAARVLVNERSGQIMLGSEVEISPVIISAPGITIETLQPPPDPTPENPQLKRSHFLDIDPAARGGTKLGQLMKALERLQVPPADRISIVKDLHKHGSLHAQLIIE